MSETKDVDHVLDLCLTPGNKLYNFFSITKREFLKEAGLSIDVIVKMNLDEDPEVTRSGNVLYAFMEEWAKFPEEDREAGAMEVLKECKAILLSAKALAEENNGVYPNKPAL